MGRRWAPLLVLVTALLVALGTAFAEAPPTLTKTSNTPTVAAAPSHAPAGSVAIGSAAPAGSVAPALPPGAFPTDPGPSLAIFPPQKLTIRFDHRVHVHDQKQQCTDCHAEARTSRDARDRLLPSPVTCDRCHGSDHGDLNAVKAGTTSLGSCAFCHEGYAAGDGNRVARLELPRPNLVFDHQKHASRNIGCAQCHGDVGQVGLATRDQLPRMRGCFNCHAHPDAANRGNAKNSCETCHLKGGAAEGGLLRTRFPSGEMTPPRWMHNAAHDADFLARHKYVAANDARFCGNCHKEDFCTDCHDGRVRPRNIHPNDYLSMHAVEGRLAMQKCTSCHREQSFCLGCHQRLGVSMSGPAGARESGRFHPPKSEWSDAPRRPGHHAFEAMRNLNACVSCHIERDCVVCHGGQGIGGGFNPHGGGFMAGCATQFQRNPRPCYVCHDPGAAALEQCR